MALTFIGLALIALGTHDDRRHAVPQDAIELPATVTEIVVTRSKISGRHLVPLYAPVVSYQHPHTGRTEELRPDSFGKSRHGVGHAATVAYSPQTGEVIRVMERPWLGMAVFVLFGLVLIGLPVVDWLRRAPSPKTTP